jgi:[protein-PII] uridylyltransferase
VTGALRSVLEGTTNVQTLFQRHRRFRSTRSSPVSNLPTRVAIDNGSSDRCTVLDVFAHDRPGLLYTITQFVYEQGLSVELAKISTHLDQVVDVFYVTDAQGHKLSQAALPELKAALTQHLEEFESSGRLQFVS